VVLITRNRLASLRRALRALLSQVPGDPFELLVVNDGSIDGTDEYLDELASRGLLIHVRGRGCGAAAARNAGIRRARSAVIACTDDDCEVPPDWVSRISRSLISTGAAAAGGRVEAASEASLPARLSQAITNGLVRGLNAAEEGVTFLTSNNVAYRTEALWAAGLFDESFEGAGGEERDLHFRLLARGERLVHSPEIVVRHHVDFGWRGFIRQQAAYGRGARVYYSRVRPGRPQHLTLAQYGRACIAALRDAAPLDRPWLVLAMPLSQAAVAWGYWRGSGVQT